MTLLCPTCGGSRRCRYVTLGVGPDAVTRPAWVCPSHPEAGEPDMHDMAGLLRDTGRIDYGGAITILRLEIIGMALKGDRK